MLVPWPGIEPAPSELEGGALITGLQGKSPGELKKIFLI